MNDEQKKQDKLEKWGRQIGYTAFKIFNLSGRDMFQIKGNGLLITVKKWNDAVNDRKKALKKVTLSKGDKSFEEEVKKIREGWKE